MSVKTHKQSDSTNPRSRNGIVGEIGKQDAGFLATKRKGHYVAKQKTGRLTPISAMGHEGPGVGTKLLPAPSLFHGNLKMALLLLWYRIKHYATIRNLLLAAGGAYLVLSLGFTLSFFVPRTIDFSFAENNCYTSPILLPNMVSKKQGKTFTATPTKGIAIAGYPLYSHTTCVTLTSAPQKDMAETINFSPAGLGFLKKNIKVSAETLPIIDYQTPLSAPVSTHNPLVFPLDVSDQFFDYQLAVSGQTLPCSKDENSVVCDVSQLGLKHSENYSFSMQRLFSGRVNETLFSQVVATVGAVQITNSSIAKGETVYNVPTELNLTLNKEVSSFDGLVLNLKDGKKKQLVPVNTKLNGQTITIIFVQPLKRSSNFELVVEKIAAVDGGHLPASYVLPFSTSGGPKVKGVSVGTYKVPTTANIVLTLDSAPAKDQDISDFVRLEINGKTAKSTISKSGRQITINPSGTMGKCTRFSVRVLDGLKNEFGVGGNTSYKYNSRTICQTVFSISQSYQGRSILAYRFGSGSSRILFVGTMHGNEKSGTYTLNSFIDDLERNYDQIPGRRTIIVIPNVNPDGFAMSRRTNARNVDLNRNFPANNWKKGVTMPGGSYNPEGGGDYPLSEPESSALADYTLGINPRLVLTYHAAAGVVMPNDADDSVSLAKAYDKNSNLYYEPSSSTDEIFTYDTTGSYEEWLYDKHDIPTLLVELWTLSSSEFYKNRPAMWYMVNLP